MEKEKEKGSRSSWASGSSDSLVNGLKFGKKIYSIDVGGVGGGGGGGVESSSSSYFSKATSSSTKLPVAMAASAAQKKGKGGGGGGGGGNQHPQHQPPRCQVEGCNIDLTGAKSYYCRHKVCGMHSKSPKVVVAGLEQRFCQQCSRFHQLHEFDQGKRSCRRRLAGHNERRRKPPPDPLSSRYGRHSSSFSEDGGRFRSFLMDFSYPSPRTQFPSREQWPTARSNDRAAATAAGGSQWQGGGFDAPHYAMLPHPYTQPLPYYPSELPLNECYTDVSGSSCALSLLSSQPWGTSAAAPSRIRAPNISPNTSSYDGAPMGQHMVATGGAHPWCYNAYGAANTNHEVQPIGIGHFAEDGPAQFSGELELALQGNRHYLQERGGPVRAYHSGNSMNWSL